MGASSLLSLHYSNLQIRHIPATNQLFLQTVTLSIKSTVAQVNVSDKNINICNLKFPYHWPANRKKILNFEGHIIGTVGT